MANFTVNLTATTTHKLFFGYYSHSYKKIRNHEDDTETQSINQTVIIKPAISLYAFISVLQQMLYKTQKNIKMLNCSKS